MGWLRAQGFRTVAMALRDDSVPLNDPRLLAEERLAIVLGTEGDGLAQATIDACSAAFRATGDVRWVEEAQRAYRWYLGQNDLDLPLATAQDGGCFDGLMPTGLNRNQGAESILALQLASCAISGLSKRAESMAGPDRAVA